MSDQTNQMNGNAFSPVPGMGNVSTGPPVTNPPVPISGTSGSTTGVGQQRLGALESIAGELLGLSTPIFPPTTFDLPDISLSNSVNSEPQGMYGGGQLMGDLTISPAPSAATAGGGLSSHQQQQMQIQQSLQQIRQQRLGQFPHTASSPSSSEDSDDLPLAQLAKRHPTTTSIAVSNNSTPESTLSSAGRGNSPSDSNNISTTTTTTAADGGPSAKKAKPSKRKKKKDPNEPQKPVSAYALFFRDTQATIKGHNPSASFGEVSKIVASMWDQLDPEHKDVYKKKTETAKKQYLKQLAAYRASQVSQSASDETEKSLSPPAAVVVSPPHTMANHTMMSSPTHQAMGAPGFGAGQMVSHPHMSAMEEQQQQQHMHQQNQQQMMQMSPQHQMMQQQQHQQQQQHSIIQHHMPQQQSAVNMGEQLHQHQQQQYHQSPPQHADQGNMYGDYVEQPREMEVVYPACVRAGCSNHARENPAWDSEYCSNDCVITHCRDIFTSWVSSRSGSSSFPVK